MSKDITISAKRWQALGVISVIQLVLLLDATVVNVALPQIKRDLGLTDASLTWVVNAYFIAAGSLLLLGGRIGDAFGVRRTFQVGIAIFGAFSLMATLAPNATVLIVARAGQGVGEALAAATGLAMVSLLFPTNPERGKAFAIWTALGGLGSIIGVLLSGVITELLSWRWVFGVNVPVILVLFVAALLLIPNFFATLSKRLDLGNALILAVAVSAIVFGALGSGIELWFWLRIILFLLGVFAIGVVLRRCNRSKDAIIPARLMTRSPRFTGYAIVAILAATSGGLFYLGVLRLQDSLAMTPLQTGFAWLPFCLGFFPGIFLSQFIAQRWSAWAAGVVGLTISSFGFMLFAIGVPMQDYWIGMMPAMLATSIGFGCVAPVAQSLATIGLSDADAGVGSGITTTIQQLFQVGGVTLLVAIAIGVTDGTGAVTIESNGFIAAFALAGVMLIGGAVLIAAGRSALGFDIGHPDGQH